MHIPQIPASRREETKIACPKWVAKYITKIDSMEWMLVAGKKTSDRNVCGSEWETQLNRIEFGGILWIHFVFFVILIICNIQIHSFYKQTQTWSCVSLFPSEQNERREKKYRKFHVTKKIQCFIFWSILYWTDLKEILALLMINCYLYNWYKLRELRTSPKLLFWVKNKETWTGWKPDDWEKSFCSMQKLWTRTQTHE